ncbi:AMP-binding protein [Kitasatospora sp. GP82]|uniref:AMP-binding protein n=1 Tax=Kitasatospora sp. GP82 TaxID=3035089 RepID=UPI002476BAF7|nr:AMP-binding protein [Kitasatospora sp. GP82]MDH6128945.1 acyl-CoA synthetase (AMP-forming)/AMP-acid ligase II [Kitasatospora sp. GP82]
MTDTALPVLDRNPASPPEIGTLGEALVRASRTGNPEGLTFIVPDGAELRQTYLQLLMEASRILAGLRAAGVRPGEQVVLQVARAPELLAAYWACILGGYVAVPLGAGGAAAECLVEPRRLHRVWLAHGAPRVITGSCQEIAPATAADPRWRHAWLGDTRRLLANVPDLDWHRPGPDDLVVLLPAADRSGTPEALALSHREVLGRSAATAVADGLDRDSRTFNPLPLDRLGGLIEFHTRDVVLGCHQIHAPAEWLRADPLRWLDVVHAHRVQLARAPDCAFGLAGEQIERIKERGWELSCLHRIENDRGRKGSSAALRLLELLEPYGLPQEAIRPARGRPGARQGRRAAVVLPSARAADGVSRQS